MFTIVETDDLSGVGFRAPGSVSQPAVSINPRSTANEAACFHILHLSAQLVSNHTATEWISLSEYNKSVRLRDQKL
jgi:hypothetical protein